MREAITAIPAAMLAVALSISAVAAAAIATSTAAHGS
jgi:hypothetical protein